MGSGETDQDYVTIRDAIQVARGCRRWIKDEFEAAFDAINAVHRVPKLEPIELFTSKREEF